MSFTIDASDTYVLGYPDPDYNGGYTVQIVNDGTLSASIAVQGQSAAIQAQRDLNKKVDGTVPTLPADAFVAILYRKLYLNGSVADGTLVSTAITTNSLIQIPAGGMTVALVVTYTSGSAKVYVKPFVGASGY